MRKLLFPLIVIACLLGSALAAHAQLTFPSGGSSSGGSGTVAGQYIVNDWYLAENSYLTGGTAQSNITTTSIACSPLKFVYATVTIKALAAYVATISAAGNFQLALYTSASDRPATLLSAVSANMSTGTAQAVSQALNSNVQVGPGSTGGVIVWACAMVDNTTVKFYVDADGLNGVAYNGSSTLSNVLATNNISMQGVKCTTTGCQGGTITFGTWPASLATSTWTDVNANGSGNMVPIVAIQAASTP